MVPLEGLFKVIDGTLIDALLSEILIVVIGDTAKTDPEEERASAKIE